MIVASTSGQENGHGHGDVFHVTHTDSLSAAGCRTFSVLDMLEGGDLQCAGLRAPHEQRSSTARAATPARIG